MAHNIKAIDSGELFIGARKIIGVSSFDEAKLSVLLDIREQLRTITNVAWVIIVWLAAIEITLMFVKGQ